MRAVTLAVSAAALSLTACGHNRAAEGGPSASRDFAVGGFDRIEVAGPYNVRVTTGAQPSVKASGPSELLDRMVVEVNGDTLSIHPKKGGFLSWSSGSSGSAEVIVGVPMLQGAEMAGSGNMDINRVAGESFQGSIAGSGDLRLGSVQVKQLGFEIAGSGSAKAAGAAERASYEIAGSGDIDAGQVATSETSAEIAGSGNISAQARSAAKVSIMGSGDVSVTGGGKCSVSKMGSGEARCS